MQHINHLRKRWRRWKLVRAYQRVAAIRADTSVRYGFVTYLIALSELENDGLLTVEDGGIEWHWPGDRADRRGDRL